MHVVYCLQLERFLCRECGKVKCSCGQNNDSQRDLSHPTLDVNSEKSDKDSKDNDISHSVEYRKPAEYSRQYSRSDQSNSYTPKPLSLPVQTSDQPFQRSFSNENGKLRRSFIVRSREGLENFLNFTSTRKGQEQGKGKEMLRQQF